MNISHIDAIEILDSRGNPTVRAFVTLSDGSTHSASVPSGASTGTHEALELRDGEKKRFHGAGVQNAVKGINNRVAKELVGSSVDNPKELDHVMIALDGTPNKSELGANAILGVSMAIHRACAHAHNMQLWQFLQTYYFNGEGKTPSFPRLMVNVINGGKHAGWAFDIQEFMIIPQAKVPSQAVRVTAEIFQEMKAYLHEHTLSTLVGDEGGFAPTLASNESAYQLILDCAKRLGYENEKDFQLGMDAAASEFYHDGRYALHSLPNQFAKEKEITQTNGTFYLTTQQLQDYYLHLQQTFSIYSFEDPFAEDDWHGFSSFTEAVGEGTVIVGDDIYVTNTQRIKKGVDESVSNSVLIKLNQIGSVYETVQAIKLTHEAGWTTAISHRSGETSDAFIADLACASGSEFIKTGSMSRGERLVKYNRLLEIEHGH